MVQLPNSSREKTVGGKNFCNPSFFFHSFDVYWLSQSKETSCSSDFRKHYNVFSQWLFLRPSAKLSPCTKIPKVILFWFSRYHVFLSMSIFVLNVVWTKYSFKTYLMALMTLAVRHCLFIHTSRSINKNDSKLVFRFYVGFQYYQWDITSKTISIAANSQN